MSHPVDIHVGKRLKQIRTLRRMSQSIASGEPPIKPVIDGFFLAISGALLLTPGVITDLMGISLLIPPVRHAVARWALRRVLNSGTVKVRTYTSGGSRSGSAPEAGSGSAPHSSSHTPPGSGSRPGNRPGSRPGPTSGSGPIVDAEFEEIKKKT